MLGWHISIYTIARRTSKGLKIPAKDWTTKGMTISEIDRIWDQLTDRDLLAVWQSAPSGTRWLEHLVTNGQALCRRNAGYPDYFCVRAADLEFQLASPPFANEAWRSDPEDVIYPELWPGRTTVNWELLLACDPDEWFLVTVWDES
jgi:hypothetical protein